MIAFREGQRVHLIGIGGAGMSAIARVLLARGVRVSGSDRQTNALTDALASAGAVIHAGHDAAYVADAELVIATSAAKPDHVEIAAAQVRGIPVLKRADILQALITPQACIAVAGTHGKTTTTSMIAHILLANGRDPSYIIGGVLPTTGTNAGVGAGSAFVIEADEYDHMFLGLAPQTAVITNIEWDHPDYFPTPESISDAFRQFASRLQVGGTLILCSDDIGARTLAREQIERRLPVITYGLDDETALVRGVSVDVGERGYRFTVEVAGRAVGTVDLAIPGRHNALNALAALCAADAHGVSFDEAARALAAFTGAGRRFEVRADVAGIAVIDDYAHHPTAIRATLEAARARYPQRTLWAVWQPHTYSRTQMLWDAYLNAFAAADQVIVTEIYAAREQPLDGVTGAALVDALRRVHPQAQFAPTLQDAAALLLAGVRAPAAVVIMSAGDAPQIGIDFLQQRGIAL